MNAGLLIGNAEKHMFSFTDEVLETLSSPAGFRLLVCGRVFLCI